MSISWDYCAYIWEVEHVMLIERKKESPPCWKDSDINVFLWENHYERGEMMSSFVVGGLFLQYSVKGKTFFDAEVSYSFWLDFNTETLPQSSSPSCDRLSEFPPLHMHNSMGATCKLSFSTQQLLNFNQCRLLLRKIFKNMHSKNKIYTNWIHKRNFKN